MSDIEETLKRLALPAGLSILAGLARLVFSGRCSLMRFCRGLVLAAFVGLATALGLEGIDLPEGPKGMIIGIAAFCADEVAMFLLAVARELRRDPLGYFSRFLSALRGR